VINFTSALIGMSSRNGDFTSTREILAQFKAASKLVTDMKSPLLWDITQGIVAIYYRRFGIKVPYIAPRSALTGQ
jgi:hypothetical protein